MESSTTRVFYFLALPGSCQTAVSLGVSFRPLLTVSPTGIFERLSFAPPRAGRGPPCEHCAKETKQRGGLQTIVTMPVIKSKSEFGNIFHELQT